MIVFHHGKMYEFDLDIHHSSIFWPKQCKCCPSFTYLVEKISFYNLSVWWTHSSFNLFVTFVWFKISIFCPNICKCCPSFTYLVGENRFYNQSSWSSTQSSFNLCLTFVQWIQKNWVGKLIYTIESTAQYNIFLTKDIIAHILKVEWLDICTLYVQ